MAEIEKNFIVRSIQEKFPDCISKYRRLIYLPLDLPEPPDVDIKLLKQFIINNETEVFSHINAKKNNVDYPWHRTSVYLSDEPNKNEFAKLFPEIIEYARHFPKVDHFGLTAVIQKNKNAFCHSDIGDWFGFRFYMNNLDGNCLYFRKSKKLLETNLRTYDENGYSINDRIEGEKIPIKKLSKKYAWIMTNTCAAHGVENINPDFDRIVFAIFFKIDWQKTRELLERSLKKFYEDALFF